MQLFLKRPDSLFGILIGRCLELPATFFHEEAEIALGRSSRVLIPADAFYEWTQPDGKQPYLIKLRDDEPMGLGGLLECRHGIEGVAITFPILTTNAGNYQTGGLHRLA